MTAASPGWPAGTSIPQLHDFSGRLRADLPAKRRCDRLRGSQGRKLARQFAQFPRGMDAPLVPGRSRQQEAFPFDAKCDAAPSRSAWLPPCQFLRAAFFGGGLDPSRQAFIRACARFQKITAQHEVELSRAAARAFRSCSRPRALPPAAKPAAPHPHAARDVSAGRPGRAMLVVAIEKSSRQPTSDATPPWEDRESQLRHPGSVPLHFQAHRPDAGISRGEGLWFLGRLRRSLHECRGEPPLAHDLADWEWLAGRGHISPRSSREKPCLVRVPRAIVFIRPLLPRRGVHEFRRSRCAGWNRRSRAWRTRIFSPMSSTCPAWRRRCFTRTPMRRDGGSVSRPCGAGSLNITSIRRAACGRKATPISTTCCRP